MKHAREEEPNSTSSRRRQSVIQSIVPDPIPAAIADAIAADPWTRYNTPVHDVIIVACEPFGDHSIVKRWNNGHCAGELFNGRSELSCISIMSWMIERDETDFCRHVARSGVNCESSIMCNNMFLYTSEVKSLLYRIAAGLFVPNSAFRGAMQYLRDTNGAMDRIFEEANFRGLLRATFHQVCEPMVFLKVGFNQDRSLLCLGKPGIRNDEGDSLLFKEKERGVVTAKLFFDTMREIFPTEIFILPDVHVDFLNEVAFVIVYNAMHARGGRRSNSTSFRRPNIMKQVEIFFPLCEYWIDVYFNHSVPFDRVSVVAQFTTVTEASDVLDSYACELALILRCLVPDLANFTEPADKPLTMTLKLT